MTIRQYASENYQKLFRQPAGQLAHPFIVPGEAYAMELWDWDSWLTDIAMTQVTGEDLSGYQQGCILNFLEHMDDQGRIPMMVAPEKQLPRVLHADTNGHKPCLAQCGQLHEYYDPETGEPVNNPGFQSWNLLAVNMQAWLNGETIVEEF